MLQRVWSFLKSPDGTLWRHISTETKAKIVLHLLAWGLIIGMTLGFLSGAITEMLGIDLGNHASEKIIKEASALPIIFLTVIMAPVLEELIFRGPLTWFRDKSYFNYVVYLSILLFGALHLFNFEHSEYLYILSPILVAPQMVLGVFLGYVRIRLGLLWAILLHAAFNAVLVVPVILIKIFNLPLE